MQALLPSIDSYKNPPAADELEVCVIGPGFGEASLIHIGDNRWVIIDSCIGKDSEESVVLRYLSDLGIDPQDVFLLIISHWDDDHTRGIAALAAACSNARIAMSKAFIAKDFLAYVATYKSPLTLSARSGVKEIRELLDVLQTSGRTTIMQTGESKQLFGPHSLTLSHGNPISIWSLAPSDGEYENFLLWVAAQMPAVGETRRVATKRIRNDLSTVIYISVGDETMLFGGDLEEESNTQTGWSAVLASPGRPNGKGSLFKVAHHGSSTGDHAGIWSTLLHQNPIAIIAPFRNGNVSLPTTDDVTRTLGYSDKSFATTNLRGTANPPMDNAVQKTIREVTKNFVTIKPAMGFVRARKKIGQAGGWRVETFGDASLLKSAR